MAHLLLIICLYKKVDSSIRRGFDAIMKEQHGNIREVNELLKKAILMILAVFMLSGCAANNIQDLEQEIVAIEQQELVESAQQEVQQDGFSAQTQDAAQTDTDTDDQTANEDSESGSSDLELDDKLGSISFAKVQGYYVRECVQDDIPYKELFSMDTDSFIRIGSGNEEDEIFSYNYQTDEFTYLYYFAGELISKVVYGVAADKVVEDDDDLADLLKTDAQLLKEYFEDLIDEANIDIEQL